MIGNHGMLLKLTWDIEVVGNLQEMAMPEGGFYSGSASNHDESGL